MLASDPGSNKQAYPQDLELAQQRDVVPSLERPHRRQALEGHAERRREHAREVDVVDVHEQADHRGHRDAAVLQLRVPEEFEGTLAANRREAKRIPDLQAVKLVFGENHNIKIQKSIMIFIFKFSKLLPFSEFFESSFQKNNILETY